MKVLLLFPLLVFIAGCVTSPQLNSSKLAELGIHQDESVPRFSYEQFYQTRGIHEFKFSSDNHTVYLLKTDGKVQNVFAYKRVERTIVQITSYKEPVSAYLVDPKGLYLFIQKDQGGSELFDLYRFNLKTGKSVKLTFGKNVERSYLCAVTSDGRKLYYSQSRDNREAYDIKVLDVNTRKAKVIKKAKKEHLYCEGLRADDTLLVFKNFVGNNEIHLGLINTKTRKSWYMLSEKGIKSYSAYFHQDEVFFLSTKGSDKRRLWKYNLKTKKIELAGLDLENDLERIGIYSEGKTSAVWYRSELKLEVRVYHGAFKSVRRFPPPIDKDISGVKFSKTDPFFGVVSVANSYTPTQYYLVQGTKIDVFFDSNQSGIENKYFAKSYSQFVKSFDGLKIPVHFYIPVGTSDDNKKPVIFWIHGGPEDHVDPHYASPLQYFANRGFVVVAPNVRGSTGFGKAFQFMDNNDWGGAHIKDIVSVVEYAKRLDFVDRFNVFIVGGQFWGIQCNVTYHAIPKCFPGGS